MDVAEAWPYEHFCDDAPRSRRASDERGREIEPMTFGTMREYGLRSMDGTLADCVGLRGSCAVN